MIRILLSSLFACVMSVSYAQDVNYDLNGDNKEDVADMVCLVNHLLKKQESEDTHEYVDLGLSVRWATCNVGASKPEESGLYFAWGETTGYGTSSSHDFSWTNYKWCNGTSTTLTKYCTSSTYGTVDSRETLEVSDDAANQNWSKSCRIPTQAEWKELYNCTWVWTKQNGVNGYKVTSKTNSNSIFLPATGYYKGTTLTCANESDGFYGCYWANTVDHSQNTQAYSMTFNSTTKDVERTDYDYRCYGYNVRAVSSSTK